MIGPAPAPGTAAARLEFDARAHRYTLSGRELPGCSTVTRVLSPELDRIPRDALARASELGTWLHAAIALDLDGELDPDTVPEEIGHEFGEWLAWRERAEAAGWRWLAWERRVCHERLGYAGTLDLAAVTPDGELALLDHKRTAEVPRSVGPQTAGYALALATEPGAPQLGQIARFALHFQPGKPARLVPLPENTSDEQTFLAALRVTSWIKSK